MELTGEQQRKYAAMVRLHEGWQAWSEYRLLVLVRAVAMIETGLLRPADVCQALGVSAATWTRFAREARPLMLDAAAEVDAALRGAGADESTTLEDVKNNPDLELALAAIGVHHRSSPEGRVT